MAWVDPTINGRYVKDGAVYTASGGKIRNSESDYSGYSAYTQAASKASTAQDTEAKRVANLTKNLGANWADIYDINTGTYKAGYSAADGTGRLSGYSTDAANPYQSALSSANSALKSQINAGVSQLESQIPTLNQSYDDIAKQGYAKYRQQQAKLPAQTSGLATGTADSLALQGRLSYENSQAQTERERVNALTGIRGDIAQLEATGDIQLAQNAEKYALLAEQYRQQQEQEAYNRMITERQWQAQQDETAYNRAKGNATKEEPVDTISLWNQYNYAKAYGNEALAAQIMQQINSAFGVQSDSATTPDSAMISNRNGNGWIFVDGIGRITYAELRDLVNSGQVSETVANGKYAYRRA